MLDNVLTCTFNLFQPPADVTEIGKEFSGHAQSRFRSQLYRGIIDLQAFVIHR